MSWSVSRPESSTNTSPCSIGFIVPASTFRYGSTFTRLTESPRAVKSFPIEAVAMPLPTPDMTPPMTKIYLCPPLARRFIELYYSTRKPITLCSAMEIASDRKIAREHAENYARAHEYEEEHREIIHEMREGIEIAEEELGSGIETNENGIEIQDGIHEKKHEDARNDPIERACNKEGPANIPLACADDGHDSDLFSRSVNGKADRVERDEENGERGA